MINTLTDPLKKRLKTMLCYIELDKICIPRKMHTTMMKLDHRFTTSRRVEQSLFANIRMKFANGVV